MRHSLQCRISALLGLIAIAVSLCFPPLSARPAASPTQSTPGCCKVRPTARCCTALCCVEAPGLPPQAALPPSATPSPLPDWLPVVLRFLQPAPASPLLPPAHRTSLSSVVPPVPLFLRDRTLLI